jgi:hypothetical protein
LTEIDFFAAMDADRVSGHALHRHFDVTTESLRREIQLCAEGVLMSHERIDRLRLEMHEEFARRTVIH